MQRTAIQALLVLLAASAAAQPEPFRATARGVVGADLLVLEDGTRVRLQGISVPTPVVRPDGCVDALRARLRRVVTRRELLFEPEPTCAADDAADLTAVVRVDVGLTSINAELLADGLAVYSCRTAHVTAHDELREAARRAQRERRGWFATTPRGPVAELPYLNGAVIGLHRRDSARDHLGELDELARAGFRHVSLIYSAFVPDVHASRIDRHHPRTVRDRTLIATVKHARERHGMRVMLLPIVLLEEAGDDDWRGTLRPRDEARFWLEYDSFLAHYLDIAEATGVELFSIGSELGALEDRKETWERLIDNARGRFTGLLTYSVNWDHVHAPRFLDGLDAVGMTAYFSLTDSDEPTVAELEAAWRAVGDRLRRDLARIGRPVFFTELGYASQNGINTDPWNYFIDVGRVDLGEQRDCFEAALTVLPELDFLYGAYWYEYYGEGGRGDDRYTPRGKPAMEVWRRWAAIEDDRRIERVR